MSTANPALPAAELPPLARIEGSRLVRHPVFLLGLLLTALYVAADVRDGNPQATFLLDGIEFLPLAAGTLIAANLAALRSRRDGTEELYASLPHPRASRITGQLLALAWTLPVSATVVAIAYVVIPGPVPVGIDVPGAYHPTLVQLAQGPLTVIALGAIGIALARLVTSPIAGVLMVIAIYAAAVTTMGDSSWLLAVPPSADAGHSYQESALTLHLAFLASVTGLAAAAATITPRHA